MKTIQAIIVLLFATSVFSQTTFPSFLQGTWKMKNREVYEHWDQLNDQVLKGFSYRMDNGKMYISEYLEISEKKGKINYTATVLGQNGGQGVDFRLTRSDSLFVFSNPGHDFPKKIIYKKLSDTELLVTISNDGDKVISYTLGKHPEKNSNPAYDPALAEKLGGDDYGMKGYIFVLLKTGAKPATTDNNEIGKLFRGHLDNITRLVKEGKMVIAGPMGANEKNYRGIFILTNVGTQEEANELLQTDPAVKAGLLDLEIYDWYGSAALPEYLPFSDKIWKSKP